MEPGNVSPEAEIARLARQVLADIDAALAAGKDPRRESRALGARLRALLTLTDPSSGPARDARLMILTAIRRTEASDQIRRGGACHASGEKAVNLPEDTDFDMLRRGLQRLADALEGSIQ